MDSTGPCGGSGPGSNPGTPIEKMKNKILISVIIFMLLILLTGCKLTEKTIEKVMEPAKVLEVIDGDTIRTEKETIRLLHVNAPEKGEKCYEEAKARLKELVENKTVWLERDMQEKDKYNRSLRYVYLNLDQHSINQQLIGEGLAVTHIILPNTKYRDVFLKTEENAIQNKTGCLWQNQSSFQGCIEIVELAKCPEDYVVLRNICNSINLTGWILRDQGRSRYLFTGILAKNSTIKITRKGWKTNHECIWDDYSNTLYIFDNENRLVLRYHY